MQTISWHSSKQTRGLSRVVPAKENANCHAAMLSDGSSTKWCKLYCYASVKETQSYKIFSLINSMLTAAFEMELISAAAMLQ
jgi:hypothetical protein